MTNRNQRIASLSIAILAFLTIGAVYRPAGFTFNTDLRVYAATELKKKGVIPEHAHINQDEYYLYGWYEIVEAPVESRFEYPEFELEVRNEKLGRSDAIEIPLHIVGDKQRYVLHPLGLEMFLYDGEIRIELKKVD